jgi:hypothetical protein
MRISLLLLFVAAFFFQCATKTTTSEETLPPITSAENYLKRLDSLPSTMKSSLEGLEIFQKSFVKENKGENDKALRAYLEFQNELIGKLEQDLFNKTEFYDRLVLNYEDTARTDQEVIAYMADVKKNGLLLNSGEGSLFLDSNNEIISEYFGPYLTDGSKEFLNQYIIENDQSYAQDGGLSISVKELGDRLIFWDKFLIKYPDQLFTDHAQDFYRTYLRTLLTGLDNTMAYDMSTMEWSKEFLHVYKSIVEKEKGTKSAQVLSRYLDLLAANDFKHNDKIQEFVDANASFD